MVEKYMYTFYKLINIIGYIKEAKKKVIIDRFEENFAVWEKESEEMINIEVTKLPIHAKEGDNLIIEGTAISIDEKCTKATKEKIKKLTEDLWE